MRCEGEDRVEVEVEVWLWYKVAAWRQCTLGLGLMGYLGV